MPNSTLSKDSDQDLHATTGTGGLQGTVGRAGSMIIVGERTVGEERRHFDPAGDDEERYGVGLKSKSKV